MGVDQTSWLAANRKHHTLCATGIIDLGQRLISDVVPGDTCGDLGSWLDDQRPEWCAGIEALATDPAEAGRSGVTGRLEHAVCVADPLHGVLHITNCALDQVRRRVQNAALGHRGRVKDPLSPI